MADKSRSVGFKYMGNRISFIRSDKDENFTDAIVNGNSENESLSGLGSNKILIRRVVVISAENLALTIAFFGRNTFQTVDLDTDSYVGEVAFVVADGVRMTLGIYPQYYYDSGALEMLYQDLGNSGEMHLAYVCRDAAGKTAGAVGYVVVVVSYELLEEG